MEDRQSANDNPASRSVRDGFIERWADADFSAITTDEALKRVAEARNEASATANRFMLFGALGAFLYLLKFEGIAQELKFGEYSLAKLPFGLFVTSAFGLTLATVSLIRIGDSRGFDRQLRLLCEKRFPSSFDAHYCSFPNSTAFGESFSMMASVIRGGSIFNVVRFISLTAISVFILALISTPAITGLHYIGSGISESEGPHNGIRWWTIFTLIIANISTLFLAIWTRLSDEG